MSLATCPARSSPSHLRYVDLSTGPLVCQPARRQRPCRPSTSLVPACDLGKRARPRSSQQRVFAYPWNALLVNRRQMFLDRSARKSARYSLLFASFRSRIDFALGDSPDPNLGCLPIRARFATSAITSRQRAARCTRMFGCGRSPQRDRCGAIWPRSEKILVGRYGSARRVESGHSAVALRHVGDNTRDLRCRVSRTWRGQMPLRADAWSEGVKAVRRRSERSFAIRFFRCDEKRTAEALQRPGRRGWVG
jgi:hypothetical protein